MSSKVFDNKRDNELIAVGTHFWCETCLGACPITDKSPDDRYCQGCYDFLLKEAEMLIDHGSNRRPYWWPRNMGNPKIGQQKEREVSQDVSIIMSTVKSKNSEVDIIPPRMPEVTHKKKGPKFFELPDDFIRELASQGYGSKTIAARLKERYRIEVSYKTIQRRLQGVLI